MAHTPTRSRSGQSLSPRLRYQVLQQMLTARRPGNLLQKGFTLVELLVVILIIGILATIGITNYLNALDAAASTAAKVFASEEAKKCTASFVLAGDNSEYEVGDVPERVTSTIAQGDCAEAGTFVAEGGDVTWTVQLEGWFPDGSASDS